MASIPPTVLVYQKNAALHKLLTRVLTCRPIQSLPENNRALFKGAAEEDYVITTEETVFHPQGGGQPSDTGDMQSEASGNVFSVKSVRKSADNQVYHHGTFESAERQIQEGENVTQHIDSALRNFHSRYHTAGHIVGLAVKQLKDLVGEVSEVKANHAPGMAFVEFRGLIASEHKAAVQEKANELVKRNLPVNVGWFDEKTAKERCVGLPEGFSMPDGADIRIVDVEGVGAYPCGGTHLPNTSDIGGIVVRKLTRAKGITKISYDINDP